MGNDFFSRLSKVNKSKENAGKPVTPGAYMLAGKQIACPHCTHNQFIEGSAQLNTSVTSALLGVNYDTVYTLVCTECGYLQWMVQPPHRMMDDGLFS